MGNGVDFSYWVNDLIWKSFQTKHFVQEQPAPLITLDIALFARSRGNFFETKKQIRQTIRLNREYVK